MDADFYVIYDVNSKEIELKVNKFFVKGMKGAAVMMPDKDGAAEIKGCKIYLSKNEQSSNAILNDVLIYYDKEFAEKDKTAFINSYKKSLKVHFNVINTHKDEIAQLADLNLVKDSVQSLIGLINRIKKFYSYGIINQNEFEGLIKHVRKHGIDFKRLSSDYNNDAGLAGLINQFNKSLQ